MVSSIFLGIGIKYCARYLKVIHHIGCNTTKGCYGKICVPRPIDTTSWMLLLSDETVKKALNQKPLSDCFG